MMLTLATCTDDDDEAATNPTSTTIETTTTTLACATVQQLLDARQLDAARKGLAANPSCDQGGIRDRLDLERGRVMGMLAEAQAAMKRKSTSEARNLLFAALAIDAGNDNLRDLLTQLESPAATTTTVDPFVAAERLDKAGYRPQAEAAVAEALKSGKTLPKGSTADLDKHRSSWELLKENWLRIVLAVLLLGLAAYEACRSRAHRPKSNMSPKKSRCTTKPYIVSAPTVGDDNSALAALTRIKLRRIGDQVDEVRLAIAPAAEAPVDLPDLTDFDAKLKPLMTLWRWILRRDVLTTNALLPAADKTTNSRLLALEFYDRRQALSTEWRLAGVTDTSSQLTVAAAYAAGWIAVKAPELRPHLGSAERTQELGTASADSLAAFLAGVEAWDAGQPEVARQLFHRAVAEDATHLRAQHNLALSLTGTGTPIPIAAGSLQLMRLLAPPPPTPQAPGS